MLIIIYIRVSTEDQARHGYSLLGQEESCTKRAKELGAKEIKIFRDEGITGSILERPGLQQALDAVRNFKASYFVVYDPDRLSRKLAHQLFISEEIEKVGCKLEFVNFDWEDSPEGRLFYSMRGAIAEYEKEKFLMRSRFGKLAKAKKGLLTHNPSIYGYSYVSEDSKLVINEEQAPFYRQMVDMALKGASLEEISNTFNEMGIPGSRGGKWYRATVRRILENKTYTGKLFINRYNTEGIRTKRAMGEKATVKQRPREDWIPILIPPLISLEKWEVLQEKLQARGRRGKEVHSYLLSGIIHCDECGRPMQGNTTTTRDTRGKVLYHYYRCYTYDGRRDHRDSNVEKCNIRNVRADKIEAVIWNKIKEWLSDPDALVKDMQGQQQTECHQQEKDSLNKHIDSLNKEKDRVFNAYRRGVMDLDETEEIMKDLKSKINTTENKLKRIQKLEESQRQAAQKVDDLKKLAEEVLGRMDELEFKDKRYLATLLIDKVVVSREEVLIIAKVPGNI